MDAADRLIIDQICRSLPLAMQSPISVALKPELTTNGGKLLSGECRGVPVHAASFIRDRRVILETALWKRKRYCRFILAHELFHFVWTRLGNPKRASFADLLWGEITRGARGELGESSSVAKERWQRVRTAAAWKVYVTESFCDSASAICCADGPEADATLARRWLNRRRHWFLSSQPAEGWRC